ncbi:hypothetical protein A2348_04655 [Candidatus Uhrbacteria bacterium RIFOXYB12_FULL_58_10]|uniref:Uncharacterized protein n=1 Tax=Candidatus Uhrbacteria bacterium RIFOXYB2_FULL_57_15 TaxID=1802422 RepID=A0A1F7W9V7_9BACT|nr:MAG: hypothetical protein A2348_04655 [Candidatus Uhrbacteria bacterium RIFOXYB12_FULL_58_10]OGL98968.1 MAG: hypothetical protein A2501_02465 [Candidatus Uhrbacteria bacterium RIFOXYC12_FULL_57_11]OGL99158.1 MAG: hypothetical protein A2304_03335 [Candidatus Uhrbacteria bacterium RIFOXYB2_FULL_57_15]
MFLFTLIACSTLDPLNKSPFDTAVEDAETDICSNLGLGVPEDSDWDDGESTIDVDWMTEARSFLRVTAECMVIPPFHIYTTQEEESPITFLTFTLASYDNGEWVEKFGDELTVESTLGELGSFESVGTACDPFCGSHWEMDLTEEGFAVSPEQDFYVQFGLPGFDDPSEVDEVWDEEYDQLAIMVYAGHSWEEETSPGHYEFGMYEAGSLLTIGVEIVDE